MIKAKRSLASHLSGFIYKTKKAEGDNCDAMEDLTEGDNSDEMEEDLDKKTEGDNSDVMEEEEGRSAAEKACEISAASPNQEPSQLHTELCSGRSADGDGCKSSQGSPFQ